MKHAIVQADARSLPLADGNRLSSGARVNQWGHPIDSGGTGGSIDDVTCGKARPSHRLTGAEKLTMGARSHTKRIANEQGNGDAMCDQVYLPPTKANPGNVLKVNVGGGVLGHPFAHENEAPYPVALVEFFIKSLCPPGGRVLDPFCGSGTTADAAERTGRNSIMCDLRASQCELTRRRLKTPNARARANGAVIRGMKPAAARTPTRRTMNGTEAAYAAHLGMRQLAGEIVGWKFEAVKLTSAGGCSCACRCRRRRGMRRTRARRGRRVIARPARRRRSVIRACAAS
jgi:hypothetical protein